MLGNPLRVRILRELSEKGDLQVGSLAAAVGESVRRVRTQLNTLGRYFMVERVNKYPAIYRINDQILTVAYVAEILKIRNGEKRHEKQAKKAGGD
jgi:DNA-binding transcriptional ArsR family regulator